MKINYFFVYIALFLWFPAFMDVLVVPLFVIVIFFVIFFVIVFVIVIP